MDKRGLGLRLFHALRLHALINGPTIGQGVIFSAHRVQPARTTLFQPNRNLTITPEFLEAVIVHVRKLGFETVSLDDVHERLSSRVRASKPFVCFTFDDGYRDNREWAYPVLAKYNVPFTIFVPIQFAEGRGVLWWEILERIIAGHSELRVDENTIPVESVEQKRQAFSDLVKLLTQTPPPEAHAFVAKFAARHAVGSNALCRELIMSWDELADFAKRPLVDVGGHTVNHYRLANLSDELVQHEIEYGVEGLKERLGRRPAHFSYPFGDPTSAGFREFSIAAKIGLKTAVTTNNSIAETKHGEQLMALPRLSLNRAYDDVRCLEVLMSGVPAALRNRIRGN